MKDSECVEFLQWSLPRLHMRWAGFRKVRKQVCKKLQQRINYLNLDNILDYRNYIEQYPDELVELDKLCRITISRFYRDKMVFEFLEQQVFPRLLDNLKQRNETELRVWCAGSGAGEEPYTIALLWAMQFASHFPNIKLSITGTEINSQMINRAERACYPYSSIKNLPLSWQNSAFDQHNTLYCLHNEYQHYVQYFCQDLRQVSPSDGEKSFFHLICCRNLAFTYFETSLQERILQRLQKALTNDGVLMIGVHEELPGEYTGFNAWSKRLGIYHRSECS